MFEACSLFRAGKSRVGEKCSHFLCAKERIVKRLHRSVRCSFFLGFSDPCCFQRPRRVALNFKRGDKIMKNLIAVSVLVVSLVGGSFSAFAGTEDPFGIPSGAVETENTFGIGYPDEVHNAHGIVYPELP